MQYNASVRLKLERSSAALCRGLSRASLIVALFTACGESSSSGKSSGAGGTGGTGGAGGSGGSSSAGTSSTATNGGNGGSSGSSSESTSSATSTGGSSAGETNSVGGTRAAGGTTGSGGSSTTGAGGDPSGGSGGQAGAPGQGGEPGIPVACIDNDAATTDFESADYGCGHIFDLNPDDDDFWVQYDVGFGVDALTGFGWATLSGSRTQAEAQTACEALSLGGLDGWRLATIDEARSLAAGCADSASGGSCAISDPSCLEQSCATNNCSSCIGSQGPRDGAYCKVDAQLCTHFHTSSNCADCASASDFIYGTSNGNFTALSSASRVSTICFHDVVPDGVPSPE